MFVSSSNEVKLHQITGDHLKTTKIYPKPHELKKRKPIITQLSLSKSDAYIAFLQQENGSGDNVESNIDGNRRHTCAEILSIRDLMRTKLIHTVTAQRDTCAVAFMRHTKRFLALSDRKGHVTLYDTKERTITHSYPEKLKLKSPVVRLEFTSDDSRLAGLCDNGRLLVFNESLSDANTLASDNDTSTKTATVVVRYSAFKAHPVHAARMIAGSSVGRCSLWDVNMRREVHAADLWREYVVDIAVGGGVRCADFTQGFALVTGRSGRVSRYDLSTGAVSVCSELGGGITALDLALNGRDLVVGGEDGTVRAFDVRNLGKKCVVECVKTHPLPVRAVRFCNWKRNVDIGELVEVENRGIFETQLVEMKKKMFKVIRDEMGRLTDFLTDHCRTFEELNRAEFEILKRKLPPAKIE